MNLDVTKDFDSSLAFATLDCIDFSYFLSHTSDRIKKSNRGSHLLVIFTRISPDSIRLINCVGLRIIDIFGLFCASIDFRRFVLEHPFVISGTMEKKGVEFYS